MTEMPDEPRNEGIDFAPNQVDRTPDEDISKAAIYARTSERNPDHRYSIDEQVRRCFERCETNGWDVEFIFEDEGMTGRNTDRSGFQQLLKMAETDSIDVVVIWKLDRFCRSLVDLVKTEEQLSSYGVALHSVTEPIDTTSPVGRFTYRNLASAAELESDLTSQRVRLGMSAMAKEARWPNSQPPLGYDLAVDQTLEIDDDEAELVREIFRLYLVYRSMPEVAHILNDRGCKTSQGNEWSRWAVRKVLSNELYRGRYQLGEYEQEVEDYQIVCDGLFETVTDVRYRFQQSAEEMGEERKRSKADKVLSQFKEDR